MKNTYIIKNNLLVQSSLKIDPVLLTSLEQAVASIQQKLQSFANEADFREKMTVAFGEETEVDSLRTSWLSGDLSLLPEIEIRTAPELNGVNGAYSTDNNLIYLSWEFLEQNKGDIQNLVELVLEEFGHRVDSLLNTQDSAGDEGAIFSALVLGESLSGEELQQLKTDDDRAEITLDGQTFQIEQATISGDGGKGGTTRKIALEPQGLTTVKFSWENYGIPDEFQILYEGKRIAGDVGLQSGGNSGERIVAKNNSDELVVKVTAPRAGTAWNFDVETVPLEININGLLGDVIEVDLVRELKNRGISLNNAGLAANGFGFKSTSNSRGEIAKIDNWQDQLKIGKFYFVPTVDGEIRQLNQARTDSGLGESTLMITNGNVEIPIKFNIQDGYQKPVIFGNTKLDVYRQQQRLAYFSFPDNNGNPLDVDGVKGSQSTWATQLFNIAVDQRLLTNRGRIPNQSKSLKNYINAGNAPEWKDLRSITNFDFPPGSNQSKRFFGTSWSGSVIQRGINTFGSNLDSTGVSQKNGSGSPSKSHDGGRGIDIESPGKEIFSSKNIAHGNLFFQEEKINGKWYLATGNNQIIINNNGTYEAGDPTNNADLARGLTTSNLIANPRTILLQISNLLVDNTKVGYNLQNTIAIIDAFKGQGVESILFNDPRTWNNGARYSGAHWGHIHVEVGTPAASPIQRSFPLSPSSLPSIPLPQNPSANPNISPLQNSSRNAFAIANISALQNAIDLGAFEETKNLTGVINSTNEEQYYRFVLGNPVNEAEIEGEYFVTLRDFSLLLDGLSSNVDVELIRDYNEDGIRQDEEVIFSSQEIGNNSEFISLTDIPEEVYHIRVFGEDGDTDYNLTLDIPSLPVPPDNAGNTTIDAANLGTLNGNLQRSDFIGQVDTDDYYNFNLSTISDINIDVDGLQEGDIFVILGRDSNNDGTIEFDESLALSDVESNSSENINVTGLTPGDYSVWISRNSGNTEYNLNLSATPSVIPLDIAGNILNTAFDIGSLNTTVIFNDFVGNVDSEDFYRFNLENLSGLKIELDSLSADADVELARDTNKNGIIDFDEIISISELEGFDAETIEISALTAGDYFVRVHQYEGDTNYNLLLTPTNPNGIDLSVTRTDTVGAVNLGEDYSYTLTVTNNGPSTANNVFLTENLLSGVEVINATAQTSTIQPLNLVDIVEFQLDAGEQVTIDIDAQEIGSTLDSVLRLFDSNGVQLAVSDDNSAPGEFFSTDSYINFTASVSDTYYIGVSGYSNFSYNPFVDGNSNFSYSSGDYTLEIQIGDQGSINQVILDEPNNTISQAFDTGLSTQTPGTFIGTGSILTNIQNNSVIISDDRITADLGTINSGESAIVNITLGTFISGELLSTTNVTADEEDYEQSNNSFDSTKTVNSITSPDADLELTQTVDNSNPSIGDSITFTLNLVNQGPGTATSIRVRDLLPQQLTYVSALANLGSYDNTTGIWTVGNMPPNESVSLSITATVNSGGLVANSAEVFAVDEGDTDSIPNNSNPNEDDFASIVLDIENLNNLPIAANDTVETSEDQPLTILASDLLSNDSDIDSDGLTITWVDNPSNGTVEMNSDGNVLFVPDSDFNGLASFDYTLSDGTDTTKATVEVTVNPVNDLPVAINDTAETNENQSLTILGSDLLSNDSDIDGDELTITGVSNSANGTVQLDTDGNILFTPDNNFNGLASFDYTVSDGTDTTSATVEITVNQNRDRNIIEGTTARDSLIGTDNNDVITGFQGADRITTGNGKDKVVYKSIVDAGDLITDFDPLNDIIDLQGVLQNIGFNGSNAIDEGYIQLVSYGSRGTSLQIDTDGADGSAIFRSYLFLQGVSVAEVNDNPNSLTFG